jgi:hypothetical protein
VSATKTTTAVAELRTRVECLENENAVLKSALGDLSRRLEQLEADRKAELEDYERREAALYEFAGTLPKPPDYGSDDPWEIARLAGERFGIDRLRALFSEE